MLECYIKTGISVYLLLGLIFVLTNFILDDEFLRCRQATSHLFELIGVILLLTIIFPTFGFVSDGVAVFDKKGKLQHREFLFG